MPRFLFSLALALVFAAPLSAQTTVFSDDCEISGSDQLLSARTGPTDILVGSSYTLAYQSGGADIHARNSSDQCRPPSGVANGGAAYVANPAPSQADYDVQIEWSLINLDSDNPLILLARCDDTAQNWYGLVIYPSNKATWDIAIYKRVSGGSPAAVSALNVITDPAGGDVFKFELRGTTLKGYKAGVEVISATDSDISAIGKGGFGFGNLIVSTDDHDNAHEADDFLITEPAAGGGSGGSLLLLGVGN